ncbi:hypothetical protein EPUS_00743 [Endocarpon pusillum Z07020]|uniref:Rhodopsin domain-containing protein n=1 Tax=Endocarpon pusillum (strain Z07020 / HMAS-L-300199) TaxID=1263415 RepID=U1GQK2_ENDPU|nr:uncharacterized protein EPUS_00743 [Endocarpon pusillum Z07020]ERF74613.1 hypothetical protein EPUS_00743 [Endocarpon pusillum Z07020]
MVQLKASGNSAVAVSVAMSIVASIALIARFVAKIKIKKLAVEDVVIIVAFSTYSGYVGVILTGMMKAGGTLDLSQTDLIQTTELLKYVYISELLFTITISLVKISILVFYQKIFSTPGFRKASFVVGSVCILWLLVCCLVSVFQCRPISAAWHFELALLGQAQCIKYGHFIIGYELSNVLLDIAIIALPLSMLKKLQLALERKIVVACMVLLGSLVCVICIIRIGYMNQTASTDTSSLPIGLDWSTVELAIAITCACLPCYGPLINSAKLAQYISSWSNSRLLHGFSKDRALKLNYDQESSKYERLAQPSEDIQHLTHNDPKALRGSLTRQIVPNEVEAVLLGEVPADIC